MRYEWSDDPAAAGLSDSGYVVVMVPASLRTDVHAGLRMLHLSGEIIEKYVKKHLIHTSNFVTLKKVEFFVLVALKRIAKSRSPVILARKHNDHPRFTTTN